MKDILLSKEGILMRSIKDNPIIRGVYFLINKKEDIVYVGQSSDCYSRLKVHKSNSGKRFVKFTIIPYPENNFMTLEQVETAYIKMYNPIYNIVGSESHSELAKKWYLTRKKDAKQGGRPKGISKKLLIKADEIGKMYLENKPIKEIIEVMDVAPNSIYRCLRHLGLKK
jgi:hypothetical protein